MASGTGMADGLFSPPSSVLSSGSAEVDEERLMHGESNPKGETKVSDMGEGCGKEADSFWVVGREGDGGDGSTSPGCDLA